MTDPHSAIRETIGKATPGEWRRCKANGGKCSCRLIWSVEADAIVTQAHSLTDDGKYGEGFTEEQSQANAAYIAAANPEAVGSLLAERDELVEELKEHEASFDLHWKSAMRGIKMWQEATGRELTQPSTDDFVVWLLNKIDELEERCGQGEAAPADDPATAPHEE